MEIIVQKFGGSSLASEEGRKAAAKHVDAAKEEGFAVVVVVSAMGRRGDTYATDTLLGLIGDASSASARDLDILMSCGEAISAVRFSTILRSFGHEVTVLNGQQAGILTDFEHGDARILDIQPTRILSSLEAGQVVVVMGFQGATKDGDVTTLGRGGSDTSATALGAALGAKYVDIFTDVDGVMTADPRVVSEANCLPHASYTEICHLAHHGAKVIHPTAVEMAMSGNVPIRVRNTLSDDPGTLIGDVQELHRSDREWSAGGVTSTAETWYVEFDSDSREWARESLTKIRGLLGNTGYVDVTETAAAKTAVAKTAVPKTVMAITPASHHRIQLASLLQTMTETDRAIVVKRCAKVAVIGSGDWTHTSNKLHRANEVLRHSGISVTFSGASSHVLWCLIDEEQMVAAVNVLHREFCQGEMERTAVTV